MKIQEKYTLLLFCLISSFMYCKEAFDTEYLQMDRVGKIETIVSKSQKAIQKKEWKKANLLLKEGIATLDDKYQGNNNVADDTGMKLFAADDQEKKGALENAAIVRERVLRIRLELYKQKLGVVTKEKQRK